MGIITSSLVGTRLMTARQRSDTLDSLRARAARIREETGIAPTSHEDFLREHPPKSNGRLITELLGMVILGVGVGVVVGSGFGLFGSSMLSPLLGASIGGLIGLVGSH